MTTAEPGAALPREGAEHASDERFMRQAIAIAERNLGRSAPNPSVGAVIVDERANPPLVIARAVTAPSGRPHAERLALDTARERARGASLFVTLEPCAHHGRTPPCAEAVVAAGIGRVVCGLEDPDLRVAGKGFALIRAAGIELVTGALAADCARLNAGHVTRVRTGRPHVTLKLAMTADGFAGHLPDRNAQGRSADTPARLRITGPIADAQTHLLRARSDGIVVGIGTVLADDPQLTVRLPGLESRKPSRIVLDRSLRIPPSSRLFRSAGETPVLIVAADGASPDKEKQLAGEGAEILRVATGPDGQLDLAAALRVLGTRGLTRLLCEGGPRLADALARCDLVDEAVLIAGSRALGRPGLQALGPTLAAALGERHLLAVETLRFGDDRWTRYERAR